MAEIIVKDFFLENPNIKEEDLQGKLFNKLKIIFNMDNPNKNEEKEIEKVIGLVKKEFFTKNEKNITETKPKTLNKDLNRENFEFFVKKMAEILQNASKK